MRDLSLEGVARKYGGVAGAYSVKDDIFPGPPIPSSVSLRTRLESLARKQHSIERSECIYGWTAAFEQTWTHIRVRIRLVPDAGIPTAEMNTLRSTWRDGIESSWNDRHGCGRQGELACPLAFEVLWVTSGEHHTVRVRRGPGRSNMTTWHTTDGGDVAAHEFGHMLGNGDEYVDDQCPDRNPVNTGTIMHVLGGTIPARLVKRLADNLGSAVVGI